MKRLFRFVISVGMVFALAPTGWSQMGAALFQQGQTRLSLEAGYGEFNSKNYLILGVGAGYYVWNGLEAGLDTDAWIGSKPHIYEASPRLTYVFYEVEQQWKPYVGGFYRRTLFDVLKPLDSAGGRAGIITPLGPRSYLSAGLVYEGYFKCDSTVYGKCSQVYPELGLGFSF